MGCPGLMLLALFANSPVAAACPVQIEEVITLLAAVGSAAVGNPSI